MTGLAEEVIADPVGLVVRLIGNVEKHLPAERVRDIALMVVRARAARRSLAQALHDDPSLLRTVPPWQRVPHVAEHPGMATRRRT
ncbi:hypothetical protein [Streptomyces sp. NRRL B-1347]|uniref:hypothetical protein n=1 Tax=Streptomyces sp. NRRL B-1347 TaxID=1476877 RepID=UPI0004CB57FA|nr:hypothetical protein [Streptomyces sp. NRRL B-1347]